MMEYKVYKWSDVLTIINGRNQNAVECEDGEYPIYGSGGVMGKANDYLCPPNCTIIGRKGNINKPIYVETKFWNVDTAFGLSANEEILNPRYLYYFCVDYNFERHNKAVTIPSLTKADLLKIGMCLPPLDKQKSIVGELDKINELIRLKKEQLKDYGNLAQSIFYEMFGDPVENEKGWEERTMQDLCVNIVDCPHSTPKKVDYITDYPCIRTSELRGGYISWATMQYLDEDEYNIRIARLKPEAGDIVFGREGTIGDAVILPLGYNFSLGQRTMLLRADTSIVSNVFLHRTILSDWIKHQIEYVNVSSTVAHVNIKDFKKFTVPLPPLPLQQLFAQRIELIEKQKAEVQRTIKDLETLLASRMQYWFD